MLASLTSARYVARNLRPFRTIVQRMNISGFSGALAETLDMNRLLATRVSICAIAGLTLTIGGVNASDATPHAAIQRQEARWLEALMKGDRATIASILAPGYKHITSSGVLLDRDQELAASNDPAPPMKWTDQTITLAGDTAIIHGLNTMTEAGKVVRERFTDVFVDQNGTWLAIAAQETKVAK
ncbi:MAG TPA: nuclear transport factor 2 family protein [Candidatus Baltobacteraceae bacterium]|nr:nuclear transport factor 2 family protein [Candidatus Baltobacteraceae bacterium]